MCVLIAQTVEHSGHKNIACRVGLQAIDITMERHSLRGKLWPYCLVKLPGFHLKRRNSHCPRQYPTTVHPFLLLP